MQGQYTHEEMMNMGNIISSVKQAHNGRITRNVGNTYNYYMQHSDGSWTNYDCKTKY